MATTIQSSAGIPLYSNSYHKYRVRAVLPFVLESDQASCRSRIYLSWEWLQFRQPEEDYPGSGQTRTGDSAQNTSINALFPAMTGPNLRGRIGGRQVWDPGRGKAASLYLAERYLNRRENQAGRSITENKKEELAPRQAFGF